MFSNWIISRLIISRFFVYGRWVYLNVSTPTVFYMPKCVYTYCIRIPKCVYLLMGIPTVNACMCVMQHTCICVHVHIRTFAVLKHVNENLGKWFIFCSRGIHIRTCRPTDELSSVQFFLTPNFCHFCFILKKKIKQNFSLDGEFFRAKNYCMIFFKRAST